MKMLKHTIISLIIWLSCFVPFSYSYISKAAASDFTAASFINSSAYNSVISDNTFINTDAMGVQDIQNFLIAKGSYLQSYSENGRSAAEIIYAASKAAYPAAAGTSHGITIDQSTGTINPEVILVYLQKEQSLISRSIYNEYAITYAMGYGCPDETGCTTASHLGFTEQVGWGAWQLRYNYEIAQKDSDWWNSNYPNISTHYYLGQTKTVSDYTGSYEVTIQTAATAAIYRYTPHVFDSAFNVWKFYNTWFQQQIRLEVDPSGTGKITAPGITCTENCSYDINYFNQYGSAILNADSGPDSIFNSMYCDGIKSLNDKCNFSLNDSHTARAIYDQSMSRSIAYNSQSGNWDANQSRFMLTGDYNNDGKDEIATFYNYGQESSRIWVFSPSGSNDLAPSSWYFSGIGNWNLNNVTYATSGDYNRDGNDDIAVFYRYFDESIRVWVFESNGTSFTPKSWFFSGPGNWFYQRNFQVTSGDFDNDGNMELATMYDYGNDTMRIWVFGNDGSKFSPSSWYFSDKGNWNAGRSKALIAGDFDADSRVELATMYDYGNDTMRIWVFGNDGSKFNPKSWYASGERSWNSSRSPLLTKGDMNLDGYDDIVVPYRYDQNMMKVWVFKSNSVASNSFSNQMWYSTGKASWEASRSPFIAVGDFSLTNTAGDMEIAFMYKYDGALTKIWLFQQTGLVYSGNN